jgi:hypothetical protein
MAGIMMVTMQLLRSECVVQGLSYFQSIGLQILQHPSLSMTKKASEITGLLSQTFGVLMCVERFKVRGCNLNEFQYGARN